MTRILEISKHDRPYPRTTFCKVQKGTGTCCCVFLVILPARVSSLSLSNCSAENKVRGNKNGPPILRKLSKKLSGKITPWQTMILTMLWLYLTRNFAKIFNLESPEPLANLYTRSFFRATWITTALDAGFWTAVSRVCLEFLKSR